MHGLVIIDPVHLFTVVVYGFLVKRESRTFRQTQEFVFSESKLDVCAREIGNVEGDGDISGYADGEGPGDCLAPCVSLCAMSQVQSRVVRFVALIADGSSRYGNRKGQGGIEFLRGQPTGG
jgi:hypothetical protein